MKKYISCLLLLLALVLPGLVMEANAAETGGSCGENLTWSLDGKGTLTISGTGDMADYASASDVPWYASRASVKSVVIKDGVTTIGDRAFYNCAALTDVTVGSGVETVGTFAFQGCSALGEIVLPAAVTALEDSAFRACTALDAMTFGGNAPTVGSNVFTDGAGYMTVWYYEGNTGFDAAPWTDYYHETMHVGQWVVDTEPGCTTLGSKHIDCAYCETTITETIPSRHDYVDGVCSGCQGIQLLGSGTCGSNLTWELDIRGVLTISGTGSMKYYYSWSNVPWSEHEENIISVIIEEGVTSISNYAFEDCTSLESVTIPDSVTEIGGCAFENCSSLKEVTIPDSVTEIGYDAFENCSSLTDVYITDIAAWLDIFYGDSDAKPLCANYLDKKLYLDGKLITNLVIPEGVTTIGDYAFYRCSSLESVTIPDSVTEIGYKAFYNCSSLESVTIGDSVTEIGYKAFYNCSSLESVTIPDSVTTIGDYTFCDCSSLESVTIPDSVTEIGEHAFSYCISLESVTIGDSVTTIGDGAFYRCSSLKSVIIPDSVTYIGYDAFYNSSLTTVHYAGTEAQKADISIGSGNWGLEEATWHYECNGKTCKPEGSPFVDIYSGDYYCDPVLWAVSKGITNGLSETTFGPEATCTRGQIVTFLWRANGSPEPKSDSNPFWDVSSSDYFYKAVLWAVEKGITSGMGDGSLAPGAPCTRGQVATFLWRACGQPAPSGTNIFTDIAPGAYYYDAVLWAVENGITNGMGDGTFAPDAPCTRGQIVTFLYRAMA